MERQHGTKSTRRKSWPKNFVPGCGQCSRTVCSVVHVSYLLCPCTCFRQTEVSCVHAVFAPCEFTLPDSLSVILCYLQPRKTSGVPRLISALTGLWQLEKTRAIVASTGSNNNSMEESIAVAARVTNQQLTACASLLLILYSITTVEAFGPMIKRIYTQRKCSICCCMFLPCPATNYKQETKEGHQTKCQHIVV